MSESSKHVPLVATLAQLQAVREQLKDAVRAKRRIGFDTEWDAPTIEARGRRRPDPLRARLVGYSLAFGRRGYYIPSDLTKSLSPASDEFYTLSRKMLGFLGMPGVEVWAHNWKSELHVMRNEGIPVECVTLDSELGAWLCGWKLPGKGGLKLKALAEAKLGYRGPDFETVARGRKASEIPPAEMAPYAARDAALTLALGELAWARMGELDLYEQWELDRRLIPVVADMERTGVPLDEARLLADADRCEAEMAEVARRFYNLTITNLPLPTKVREQQECSMCDGDRSRLDSLGQPCTTSGCVSGLLFYKNGKPRMRTVERDVPTLRGCDVGNDRQVSRWLFDALGWWPQFYNGDAHPTTANGWSVAEEDIRRFTELPGLPGEAARLRLRFQALRKYASTYTRGLVDLARQSGDGRLHCSFKQDGTSTQRFSSSGPNLQNLPSSERQDLPWLKDLPDIRAAFTAAPGWRVVERDLSQIELRLIAHFSQDESLVQAYRKGEDLHAMTQARLGGIPRRNAKIVNFSTAYLISARSLRMKVCMATNDWTYTEDQAQAAIDGFYAAYPGVREMQERLAAEARTTGVARTITGFVEPIPAALLRRRPGMDPKWSTAGERKATNTPIQGSAAGLLKRVLVALYERWARDGELGRRVRFVAQVHDSIVVEAREDFAAEANRQMGECMAWVGRKYGLLVPLESSGGVGANWAEAK